MSSDKITTFMNKVSELIAKKAILQERLERLNRIERISVRYGATTEYQDNNGHAMGDNSFVVYLCSPKLNQSLGKEDDATTFQKMKECYSRSLKKELQQVTEELAAHEGMRNHIEEILGGWTYDSVG